MATKDIWVFCEQRGGVLSPSAAELLGEGRRLADDLGSRLYGVLLGDGVSSLAAELGGWGADEVLLCEHPLLREYTTDAYCKVVCDLAAARGPEILLMGATHIGRDLAARCAARLRTGLCADCTHLDVDMKKYTDYLRESSTLDVDGGTWDTEDRNLKMTRPAFGGHLMATIICPHFRPCMATVRPGVMKKGCYDAKRAAAVAVTAVTAELCEADIHTAVLETVRAARALADLTQAEYIVAVGRGIARDVEGGLRLARQLAEALGGMVAGSRAVIDAGWLPPECQVGQTGKTVRPRVYVALGISGAIQHMIGMQDSDCIVAVNTNRSAPLMEAADYGICGDLFTVVPLLTEALQQAKMEK